jgi:hypothetical protein
LSNQRCFFSLGIGFHYKKWEAYVFIFHRSGLSSSPPLKLTTVEGLKGLVSHIICIPVRASLDLGHYNLFDKARGILHRDISSGNVLRYSEPIWRPALVK